MQKMILYPTADPNRVKIEYTRKKIKRKLGIKEKYRHLKKISVKNLTFEGEKYS